MTTVCRVAALVVLVTGLAVAAPTASDASASDPVATPAAAAGSKDPAGTAAGPGPEYDLLKSSVGVWDATVTIPGEPGSPPHVSKGVETITLGRGGLWMITDFVGTMGEQPFQGHGIMGYDPVKKRYVSVWVDSTAPSLWLSEGDYDPTGRTLTMWMEGPDEKGDPVRWRLVTVSPDRNSRTFTMYAPGTDGDEQAGMTITYRRRR